MKKYLLVIFLSILFVRPAFSRVKVEIIPEDYTINPGLQYKITQGINFLHHYYGQIFYYSNNFRIRIRIFGNPTKYRNYKQKHTKTSRHYPGMFIYRSSGLKEAIINGTRPENKMLSTLFHESSHAFLIGKNKRTPAWLNEGLAEYFETMNINEGKIEIQPQSRKDDTLKGLLKRKRLKSLQSIVELSDKEFQSRRARGYQATGSIAWSLIFYLMSSEQNQSVVKSLLEKFKSDNGLSSVVALDESYPGKLESLEKDWRIFLSKPLSIQVYSFP